MTIFVDPLDATKDFVWGIPQNVTCLIGITYENWSKIGIVHQPFEFDKDSEFGVTYFGGPEIGVFKTWWKVG